MTEPDDANRRLATYGTLGPGRPNHHHLADLGGRWLRGSVRGRLVAEGWGAAMGFHALVLDAGDGEAGTHQRFRDRAVTATHVDHRPGAEIAQVETRKPTVSVIEIAPSRAARRQITSFARSRPVRAGPGQPIIPGHSC